MTTSQGFFICRENACRTVVLRGDAPLHLEGDYGTDGAM
jgi:hypothetical protein